MSNLNCFKAWCSGKAYTKPDAFVAVDNIRAIAISTGGTLLGRFYFKRHEYKSAKNHVKRVVNKQGGV